MKIRAAEFRLRVSNYGLIVGGYELRFDGKKGIAPKVRHRLMEGAGGSKRVAGINYPSDLISGILNLPSVF